MIDWESDKACLGLVLKLLCRVLPMHVDDQDMQACPDRVVVHRWVVFVGPWHLSPALRRPVAEATPSGSTISAAEAGAEAIEGRSLEETRTGPRLVLQHTGGGSAGVVADP